MMINKWLMAVLIILSIGGRAVYAQLRLPVELELSGFNYISPVPVYLSEDDNAGCSRKKVSESPFMSPFSRRLL